MQKRPYLLSMLPRLQEEVMSNLGRGIATVIVNFNDWQEHKMKHRNLIVPSSQWWAIWYDGAGAIKSWRFGWNLEGNPEIWVNFLFQFWTTRILYFAKLSSSWLVQPNWVSFKTWLLHSPQGKYCSAWLRPKLNTKITQHPPPTITTQPTITTTIFLKGSRLNRRLIFDMRVYLRIRNWPLMEDDLWWKTTFVCRAPLMDLKLFLDP